MPTDSQPLITLGPFIGLDTRSATEFVKPGYGTTASSVDTGRKSGALMNQKGRTQLMAFPELGPNNPITAMARYDYDTGTPFYIVQGVTPLITAYWGPTGQRGTLPLITTPWRRAIQFNAALYLDSGHQVYFYNNALQSCLWQYPTPSGGYAASINNGSSMPLTAATYSYAFVRVYLIPLSTQGVYQQTTPYFLSSNATYTTNAQGTTTYQPGTLVTNGTQSISLQGDFFGTTVDGISYTTDVYRMSSNSNVFNYLFSIKVPDDNRVDTFSDQSIAANQQLVLNRDQPPTGVSDYGTAETPINLPNAIEALQDRMWVLARQDNDNTYNQPQNQLWYSEVGAGWSFDAALGTTLVAQEHVTVYGPAFTPAPVGYGDQPTALCAVASQLLIWGQTSTSILYGTDETNFTVLPLFKNVGCVAPLSPTKIREGIVAWLSALGAFGYNQLELIDLTTEKLRNLLRSIPAEYWPYAVGAFRGNRWYLSFPGYNITLVAYFTIQNGQLVLQEPEWTTLPYAMSATAWCSSAPQDSSSTAGYEQLIGARANTMYIDEWGESDSDLGEPITLTWVSPNNTCGSPFSQKTFRHVAIVSPPQPTTLTLSLALDVGFPSTVTPAWTSGPIDLSVAPTTKIINIPNNGCKGYSAQLTVTATNNGVAAIEIWEIVVGGTVDRAWVSNA